MTWDVLPSAIIFDTSVLEGDFRFRSGEFNQLVNICQLADIELKIPRIVIDELISHYKNKFPKIIKDISRYFNDLDRYIFNDYNLELNIPSVDYTELYENWIDNHLISINIDIVDYPQIDHRSVVLRSLNKRKPFKEKDRGYKDTLIWENVVDYLKSDKKNRMIFIAGDGDFSSTGAIHEDLEADLNNYAISPDRLLIISSIGEVLIKLQENNKIAKLLETDEKKIEWASIGKKQLSEFINFEETFNDEISTIEAILKQQYILKEPSNNNLLSFKIQSDLYVEKNDFISIYLGKGNWNIDGLANLQLTVEIQNMIMDYNDINNYSVETTIVPINASLKYSSYYDLNKKELTSTSIKRIQIL